MPAIAVTLAVFAAVQVAVPLGVRPYLIPPVRTVSALSAGNITAVGDGGPGGGVPNSNLYVGAKADIPGAWVYSSQVTAPDGSTVLGPVPRPCVSGSYSACTAAVTRLRLRQVVTYQPASRYWAFQCAETGLYLLVALLLAGFCTWRVNRRRLTH